jgi:hypothetical protein
MSLSPDLRHTRVSATPVQRLRARWFVWRVDHHLDGRMPRRRRREIRRELRANLAASADDHGLKTAIERLGHPATLADGYTEAIDYPVRWRTGALAATAVFTVMHALTLLFHVAFTLGARAVGGDDVSFSYAYEIASGWGPFVGSGDPPAAFEVLLLSPVHLILIATAWLLGSRIWRWRPATH